MIDLKTILKLAAKPSTVEATRSVVFTGKTAMTMNAMDWIAGVPCEQPGVTKPVVVPIGAIQKHLAKSRHLVVTPDGLTNGSNITTAFDFGKHDYAGMLDLMPKMPETKPVQFELDLDALDRVQVVAARQDIRYYLNGVVFDLTNGALVATDGHRLHLYRNRVPQVFDRAVKDGKPTKPDVLVICPNDPLDFIVNSGAPEATVCLWDADKEKQGCILLNAGDAFVWVRKPIEGKFPDWQRVVPTPAQRPVWAEVDPVAMADAAAAVVKIHKVAGTKGCEVQLNLVAQALIATTKERDRVPVPMKLLAEGAGHDLFVNFHAPYLQDVADCVTVAAQWRVAGKNESLLVVEGDFSGVVMPTRHAVNLAPETAQAAPVAADGVPAGESAQEAPQGLPAPVKAPRLAKKARKPAQEAQEVPQVAPVAAEAAQAPESVPDAPQVAESEPVPAAVAAVAAQLVQGAQETARKAPRKPRKAPQAAPVAA